MEVLSQQGEGAFLVRESASSPGSHALSLKAPQGKIVHYMIQTSPNGVNLQVSDGGLKHQGHFKHICSLYQDLGTMINE